MQKRFWSVHFFFAYWSCCCESMELSSDFCGLRTNRQSCAHSVCILQCILHCAPTARFTHMFFYMGTNTHCVVCSAHCTVCTKRQFCAHSVDRVPVQYTLHCAPIASRVHIVLCVYFVVHTALCTQRRFTGAQYLRFTGFGEHNICLRQGLFTYQVGGYSSDGFDN